MNTSVKDLATVNGETSSSVEVAEPIRATKSPKKSNSASQHEDSSTDAHVGTIRIERLRRRRLVVPVVGTAPLIVHRFEEKARREIADKQQGRAKTKTREPKDPHAQFEAAMHRLPDGGHGFPVVGFKAAMIGAARNYPGVKMTELKQIITLVGEYGTHGRDMLARLILDDEPIMREDPVRIGMGTADLRYRPEYDPWRADLVIEYITTAIDAESLVNLVDAAGSGGIGEWRPSKSPTGVYGTFQVDFDRLVSVG